MTLQVKFMLPTSDVTNTKFSLLPYNSIRNMTKATSFDINILRITKWDFDKAAKLQKIKDTMSTEEFDLIVNSALASNELAMGTVNKERLITIEKCLNHFKKYRKQYMTLGMLSIFFIVNGMGMYANAIPTMGGKVIECFANSSTTVASSTIASTTTMIASSMPSIEMGYITSVLNKLISNLIKLGVLSTISVTAFDMLKSIIEGNMSKLPKILINNGLMVCCILISPTVFNSISGAFKMGNVLNIGSTISRMIL